MTKQTSPAAELHPVLSRLGFTQPTEIQRKAIPVLATGQSLLALAPTGSGKTLAFLIPLMERLDTQARAVQLLVLTPTRELGLQISQVATQVAIQLQNDSDRALQVRTAFGGQRADNQKAELLKKPEVVIATPGRALELLEQDVLQIGSLQALVLDEADIMVGMGFEAQVKSICDFLPKQIQAALFSATESEGQSRLQNRLVHRGAKIDVRSTVENESVSLQSENLLAAENTSSINGSANSTLHQTVVVAGGQDRLSALSNLLDSIAPNVKTGIIFCQTRESVQTVSSDLREKGCSVAALSGELGQIERATILRRFKSGGLKYLVATNLASRGIDVNDLSVVINYELPSTPQEYIHRSGRSGRAGKPGWTISLCTRQSREFLQGILKDSEIKLCPFVAAETQQLSLNDTLNEVNSASVEKIQFKSSQSFQKIHLNRGKSSKIRPGDILGALTKDLGLTRDDVGGIFIFDHFTHVEIAQVHAKRVMSVLSNRKIKNMAIKATEAQALAAPRKPFNR